MSRKKITQVLSYLFTFWLGAKMVILTNIDTLSTYDWVSLGINILFMAYFILEATKQDNNPKIL
jgi:hypothetical protein